MGSAENLSIHHCSHILWKSQKYKFTLSKTTVMLFKMGEMGENGISSQPTVA
jgi:hypothetical protein